MTEQRRRPHLQAVTPTDTTALQPPNDNDAERAVLGAMLQSRDAVNDATLLLTGNDFYQPRHELIYDAALHLFTRLQPVDLVSVADQLTTTGDLTRVGGHSYLAELLTATLTTTNVTHHARIVARHATRRRLAEAGTRIHQLAYTDDDTDPTALLQHASTALADIPTHVPGVDPDTTANTWAPVDLADILENGEQLEQPTHLARTDGHHLLYPAAVHSISGEPESGKTWVALIAAAQTLRHTDEHVTYVDFEDRAGRVVPRLVQLGAPAQAILERFHYIRPVTALDDTGRAHLDQVAAQSSLAIVDGVTEAMTMHGLSLMDNEDAARYLDLLPRHLADHGCAVLQIDHVVKDSEKQGRWAIGAGHKLAGLDGAAYGIKVAEPFGRGKIGRARIAVAKDRPGAIREYATESAVATLVIDSRGDSLAAWLEEPGTMPVSEATGEMRPTHLMEKVSRYIEMTPGATGKQIEEAIRGKAQYVRLAIRTLVSEGFVTVEEGARGAQLHTSYIRFREASDDDA